MITTLIAFFAAVMSALGMGGGSILLMYLTAALGVDQLKAQGINLVFFLPVAVVALFFHIKNKLVDLRRAAIFIAMGLPGVWLGATLAMRLDRAALSKCFGGLLLVMGVKELLPIGKKRLYKKSEK